MICCGDIAIRNLNFPNERSVSRSSIQYLCLVSCYTRRALAYVTNGARIPQWVNWHDVLVCRRQRATVTCWVRRVRCVTSSRVSARVDTTWLCRISGHAIWRTPTHAVHSVGLDATGWRQAEAVHRVTVTWEAACHRSVHRPASARVNPVLLAGAVRDVVRDSFASPPTAARITPISLLLDY